MSSAVLPLLLDNPGLSPSIHISICLPTRGQETEFIHAIPALTSVLEDAKEHYEGVPIFVRGDAN